MKISELLDNKKINPNTGIYLIKYYLGINDFQIKKDITLSKELLDKYKQGVERLLHGESIQYIVGTVNFYGLTFKVNKNVLIPRFETEELVENTTKLIKEIFNNNITICDIGTGSGVIAITLKELFPSANVLATDISLEALDVAKENANNLGKNITFFEGNMLEPLLKKQVKVDVLISNPPYIKNDEKIEQIVQTNEPHIALYGGADGLIYYRNILENAKKVLNSNFLIAFEMGMDQANSIIEMARIHFPKAKIILKKDLSNKDRMIFIYQKNE